MAAYIRGMLPYPPIIPGPIIGQLLMPRHPFHGDCCAAAKPADVTTPTNAVSTATPRTIRFILHWFMIPLLARPGPSPPVIIHV